VRNHELQWYQPDNAKCANGILVIEARREKTPNPNYDPNSRRWQLSRKESDYTSAAIETRGKQSWRYGRFEMRARIDIRPGSWPAFWCMGIRGGWPACGEVDIMEYYRDVLLANVGWKGNGPNGTSWNTGKKPLKDLPANWADQFHIWRMDWDENSINLYCDDQLLNTQDLTRALNPDGTNPFHQPHYLLLNQAIGGDCGGDPSGTSFPVRFEIDYVRIYQKPSQMPAK
jgi:beta-glucanase (GH16 family)